MMSRGALARLEKILENIGRWQAGGLALGKRLDMMCFERFVGSLAPPRWRVRVVGVCGNNSRSAKSAEQARIAMVVLESNLTEEFGDALVP